ncbi:hypothetical protein A2397_05480 [Candidatus Amesbacteria bacterium RIFOXYB1_FULL_44_23]|uniref:Glycosyl hydrolase family 13 catalytic domain-containing protein n=1 Tax=Candidatus Amesbacteria bacterium RIFOXYB1_FULL_44_23 TaxID=1797263 RepID=A0A1F4ZQ85_9BACT|nr:MAG: hypothetical protein A2397_05480 [Candidatus Amesbacteria bacterium RIFOXYB1_FULL_44_23]
MPDMDWWKKAVIYELYVDKFAGDFSALTAKLDYFTYLGVNTLWILPHYPSPMVDGGYDISDYQDIRPGLGSMEDFDRFIEAAHSRGLKVIIDLVLNHTSSEHAWFRQAKLSKSDPKRLWYIWSDNQIGFSQAFVHFAHLKPTNWIFNPETNDYYYATFYPQQPDLNWDNPEVEAAMLSVIDYWLDKGVDGLRLDAVARLIKRENTNCFGLPETHQVLKRIRSHIDSRNPGVVLMAETGGWPNEAKQFFGSGDECQLVINFPLAVQLLNSIHDKNLSGVEDVWNQSGGIPDNCRWATFLTNHDSVDLFFLTSQEQRITLKEIIDPEKLFSQPDGQSLGARLAEVCRGNGDDILWATKQLLSKPGIPILYYGNEIGMRNLVLSEKPGDIREFVRGTFDWSLANLQMQEKGSLLSGIRQEIHDTQFSFRP